MSEKLAPWVFKVVMASIAGGYVLVAHKAWSKTGTVLAVSAWVMGTIILFLFSQEEPETEPEPEEKEGVSIVLRLILCGTLLYLVLMPLGALMDTYGSGIIIPWVILYGWASSVIWRLK